MEEHKAQVKLNPTWLEHLQNEFDKPYMGRLKEWLIEQREAGKTIYPKPNEWFNALNTTDLDKVKAVILGQDPYHGPGQAHGLCFSVRAGIKPPPSLVNIYRELFTDIEVEPVTHGDLSCWAKHGVLLLNSVLTVEKNKASSHRGQGWETFTDKIIEIINKERENVVFFLWGSYAQKKGELIDREKHLVLTSSHPSPLSAYRGFLGCKHFSQCNSYLISKNLEPINWQLPFNPSAN